MCLPYHLVSQGQHIAKMQAEIYWRDYRRTLLLLLLSPSAHVPHSCASLASLVLHCKLEESKRQSQGNILTPPLSHSLTWGTWPAVGKRRCSYLHYLPQSAGMSSRSPYPLGCSACLPSPFLECPGKQPTMKPAG